MIERLVLCVAIVFGLLGCSRAQEAASAGEMAEPGASHGARARVITVSMELEHRNMGAVREQLRRMVEEEGGWVASASSDASTATLVLRVPADRLRAFRRGARAIADRTVRESESVEDAGDQVADVGARLRSARREEERLLSLMSERTASLADVIAVEERLAHVRERIERLDGERAVLEQRVDYATVNVYVSKPEVAFWERPIDTVIGAARFGVDALCAIGVGLMAAAAAIGPTAISLGLMLVMLIAAVRALLRRRPA